MTTETKQAKHTPGPWRLHRATTTRKGFDVEAEGGGRLVAYNLKDEADARLIAAAPELLDALQELLTYLGDWDDPEHETCVKARAAIAKATA